MMTDCPECGKHHVVTWPEMSPFRRGDLFYCCHECWETSVRRDLKKIKDVARNRRKASIQKMSVKITEAVKARAVEIALGGENPLPYLKQAGAANPSACWQYIKKQLEKRDPEKYAALPGKLPKAGTKDVPSPIGGGDWEKAEVPEPVATVNVDGPLKIETPERIVDLPDGKMMQIPELPKPMEYRITGISTTAGDFQYFRKQGFIDWTDLSGETVSMSLAEWANLMRVWPEVLRVLGVEL